MAWLTQDVVVLGRMMLIQSQSHHLALRPADTMDVKQLDLEQL